MTVVVATGQDKRLARVAHESDRSTPNSQTDCSKPDSPRYTKIEIHDIPDAEAGAGKGVGGLGKAAHRCSEPRNPHVVFFFVLSISQTASWQTSHPPPARHLHPWRHCHRGGAALVGTQIVAGAIGGGRCCGKPPNPPGGAGWSPRQPAAPRCGDAVRDQAPLLSRPLSTQSSSLASSVAPLPASSPVESCYGSEEKAVEVIG